MTINVTAVAADEPDDKGERIDEAALTQSISALIVLRQQIVMRLHRRVSSAISEGLGADDAFAAGVAVGRLHRLSEQRTPIAAEIHEIAAPIASLAPEPHSCMMFVHMATRSAVAELVVLDEYFGHL